MTSITQFYEERCYVTADEKLVPKYWHPQVIDRVPYTLHADATRVCDSNWGVHEVIQRILALGLELELPVGEFVADYLTTEERSSLRLLLKSNVADEAHHFRGFQLAVEAYPLSEEVKVQAKIVSDRWMAMKESTPTIALAAALEIGVFLPSLAALRLFGGSSLARMADGISRDEYRHAAVNRMLVDRSGYNLMELSRLVLSTVVWVFQGLNMPQSILGVTVDGKFFERASYDLMLNGSATQLDDLVNYADHLLPFEISNHKLY